MSTTSERRLLCGRGRASLPCEARPRPRPRPPFCGQRGSWAGLVLLVGFAPVLSAAEHAAEGQEPLWVSPLGTHRSLSTA